MTAHRGEDSWFSSQVDPEHVVGRGFTVALSRSRILITDADASTPPPLVLRSAWGRATRTPRVHDPYDFQPWVFAGVQLWDDRALTLPIGAELFPSDQPRSGSGAYIGSTDASPAFADVMEFVFLPDEPTEHPPLDVFMAQVLLDMTPSAADPFVVATIRILEPLLVELRRAAEELGEFGTHVESILHLRTELDEMDANLRHLQGQPSKLRGAARIGLAALGAIVLNIAANRLDPMLNRVDWVALWNAIESAARRLGLG